MSYLYLDENQFTGSGSDVLNFVGPQVVDLELSQNSFSGKIPFDRNDTANLKDFYIRENFFTGSFPNGNQVQEYALLSNISKLDFGSNRFSGTLPSSLQLVCVVFYMYQLYAVSLSAMHSSFCILSIILFLPLLY